MKSARYHLLDEQEKEKTMIAMLIADNPETERKKLLYELKWQAAKLTEDEWKWVECGSAKRLDELMRKDIKFDLMCLDLTMQTTEQVLVTAEKLREALPIAHMILIANTAISPVKYMRPSIGAQSLLLKPLDDDSMREVLEESIRSYISKFRNKSEEQYFVVETRGERELFSYDRIMYFEAREKKVFLNSGEMEYPFYDTLDQLEKRLGERFIRCHRGFLVNKSKISKVYLSQNTVLLNGGEEIPVSRSYKPVLKQYMAGM